MKVLALTGGVASGKNFIANIFEKNFKCKTFDADHETHELISNDNEVKALIIRNFPDCIHEGQVSRHKLGLEVFNDIDRLQTLEKIIHPRVQSRYQSFLKDAKSHKLDFIVLNIPLLLEKGHYDYDHLIAIATDKVARKKRYIKRELKKDPTQYEEVLERKFDRIAKNQFEDDKRKALADFTIDGSLDKNDLKFKISQIMLEVWEG